MTGVLSTKYGERNPVLHIILIINTFEKHYKMFFLSLFTVCFSLLPFSVKFEQLNINIWPKSIIGQVPKE